MSARKKPGLYVKTFGCQMNEYDTEKVVELLAGSHEAVESPENAEVVFVNTCSVREKGEHKLFSLLGSLRELKRERPELVIGVGGCVAQQEGQAILKRNTAVDFVVGTHNLSLVPSLVQSVREGRGAQVAVDYREEWEDLPTFGTLDEASARPGSVRALVAIQRGCNKRCAFCVVPTTRGPEVSRDPREILRETRLKARAGAKEVLLLGQTVNSFGRDLSPRYPFERLIREIAEIDGIRRIRFTSPHPAEVRPEFLDLYRDVPQLCPHIHLPLQSGSDRILKLMNRNYRTGRYLEIVDSLRERCPEIALSTDIIVGFPTESTADYEQTLEILERVRYHVVYSFKYSRRPNTVAISSFAEVEEIPVRESHERLLRLQALQDEISRELNAARVGTVAEVLVEERPQRVSSSASGRIPQNTPIEISQMLSEDVEGDGSESVDFERAARPGETVNVLIEHATPHGLRGRKVGDGYSAGESGRGPAEQGGHGRSESLSL